MFPKRFCFSPILQILVVRNIIVPKTVASRKITQKQKNQNKDNAWTSKELQKRKCKKSWGKLPDRLSV